MKTLCYNTEKIIQARILIFPSPNFLPLNNTMITDSSSESCLEDYVTPSHQSSAWKTESSEKFRILIFLGRGSWLQWHGIATVSLETCFQWCKPHTRHFVAVCCALILSQLAWLPSPQSHAKLAGSIVVQIDRSRERDACQRNECCLH